MIKKFWLLVSGILLSVSAFSADLSSDEVANLIKKAESGDAVAQNVLADEYKKQNNESKWLEWLTKSANNGYMESQFRLGELYNSGYKLSQSNDKAIDWYTKSANQGHRLSYRNLSFLYSKKKNYDKAIEVLIKASDLGDSVAQNLLGIFYSEGKEVKQDIPLEQQWFYKSCLNGDKFGCDKYKSLHLINH